MTRLLATAAIALAAPALAQVSSGTITGLYNADEAVWTIGSPDTDSIPQSGWRDVEGGVDVTMVGLPGPTEVGADDGTFDRTLVVTFTLEGQPQALNLTEPTVWMVSDAHEERMLAHPANVELSLTAAERTGGDLTVAGDLVARLTPGGLENLTIESEDAVLIDGNFQATLARTETEDGASGGDGA